MSSGGSSYLLGSGATQKQMLQPDLAMRVHIQHSQSRSGTCHCISSGSISAYRFPLGHSYFARIMVYSFILLFKVYFSD